MHTIPKTLMAAALTAAFAAAPLSQADAHALGNGAAQQSANQTIPGKANDAWITTKVKSEFATNRGVDATDIDVDTQQGHVTLKGRVANANEKMEAERLARNVVGVKSVDTSGLTMTGAARADDTQVAGVSTDMGNDDVDQRNHAWGDNDNQTVPGKANDGWITTKVKSEFATTGGVDATDINVTTRDGRVTLKGTVSGQAERNRAEQLARSVVGVRSVDASGLTMDATASGQGSNDGVAGQQTGSMTGNARDGWLTTKVKSQFATTNGVDATDINVDTSDGRVTLRGNVATTAEKNNAERLARSVDGVTSVDASGLRVTGAGSQATGASYSSSDKPGNDHQTLGGTAKDGWITTKVKSQFATTSGVDATDINVDTRNGQVTLRGTVDSMNEKNRAEQIARSTDGVTSVDSSGLRITGQSDGNGYADSGNNGMDNDNQTAVGATNDAWITAKVKSKLAVNGITDASDINVDTNNGRVVLRGNVANSGEKDAAVRAARSIEGVKQVDVSGLSIASSD